MKVRLFAVVSLIIMSSYTTTVAARVITVDDDGIADFPTIQQAIDAARGGDTVMVMAGLYQEQLLRFKSGIALRGAGRDVTRVEMIGQDIRFSRTGLDIGVVTDGLIEGFEFVYTGDEKGMTIWMWKSNDVVISDCRITGSVDYSGFDIWYSSGFLVENNIIEENGDNGIYIERNSEGLIIRNFIRRNGGSGIRVLHGSSPEIRENIIVDHQGEYGDGVSVSSGENFPKVINNTIVRTRVGVASAGETAFEVTNNIIVKNKYGVIIFSGDDVGDVSPILDHNNVWDNSSKDYSRVEESKTDISVNPLFVDLAKGDYHLLPESPCRGAADDGSDLGAYPSTVASSMPIAKFSANITHSTLSPVTVSFMDLSRGDPTTWRWDFGDGGTSILQNPMYTYTQPGDYTVTLIVTNAAGPDTEIKEGYIHVSADFALTGGWKAAVVATTDERHRDEASATQKGDAFIIEAGGNDIWDYEDQFTFVYQEWSGDFDMIVTFNSLAWTDDWAKAGIMARQSLEPGSVNILAACAGGYERVTFQYRETHNGESQSERFAPDGAPFPVTIMLTRRGDQFYGGWSLDGGKTWEQNITKDGVTPTPPVTLRMEDPILFGIAVTSHSEGDITIAEAEVLSSPLGVVPIADFSADPTFGPAPLTVKLTDLSQNGPVSWQWNFGDGGTSDLRNPTHTYAEPGYYTVSLTVASPAGSHTETKEKYIHLPKEPSVDIASEYERWENGILTVEAEATDIDGNVVEVLFQYSLDQGTWQNIDRDAEPPYSVDWDTTSVIPTTDDSVWVKAIATDNDGLKGEGVIDKSFGVDNELPTTGDNYDGERHEAGLIIELTGDDKSGSGMASINYRMNDGVTKSVSADGHPKVDTEGDNNKLEYWGTDHAGNVEEHHILPNIKVEKPAEPATLSILAPTADQALPVGMTSTTLTVSITNHTGIWHWNLDEAFPPSGPAGGNPVASGDTATITDLEDGKAYTAHVALVDADGNLLSPSVTASVAFSVAVPAPTAELIVSALNTELTGTAGGFATYLITLEGKKSFAGNVKLFSSDLPPNVEAVFKPKVISLSETEPLATSQLTLTIPTDIAPHDYPFTVLAVPDSGKTKELTMVLKIEEILAITSLTLNLHPTAARFMEELNALGQLISLSETQPQAGMPVPPELGSAEIQIIFTAPSGRTQTFETTTDTVGKYELARPFLPDEVGSWGVKAQFAGNTELKASEREDTFNVTKGYAEIVFNTDPIGALGMEIDIEGHLEPQLAGELLSLKILRPDGSASELMGGIITEAAGAFQYKLKVDISGDWEITAIWPGNDQYEDAKQILVISVSEEIGKAILVLGGGDRGDNPEWVTFNRIVEYVHGVFLKRNFDDEKDIYFLSPDPGATAGADNVTSATAMEYAITDWAAEHVNAQVPLYIYLLSHSLGDQFLLEKRGDDETYLTPGQLDSWLDLLPGETPVTIVIEACHSGNFIRTPEGRPTMLVGPNRTVIASARGDKQAKILPNRSSFSKAFFDRIYMNDTISEAFRMAEERMERLPHHRDQFPQMDADGDGHINRPQDYAAVARCYLPTNITSLAEPPEIIGITPSQILPEGVSSLWISVELIGVDISRVSATAIPPDFDPTQEIIDWSELEFPEFDLAMVSAEDARYEYAATYARFIIPGDYTVIVDAENPDGSATPVQTTITVPGGAMVTKGDVNNDGRIRSNDAILALRMAAGLMEPDEYQRQAADMNGDGRIRSNDAILILRRAAGG